MPTELSSSCSQAANLLAVNFGDREEYLVKSLGREPILMSGQAFAKKLREHGERGAPEILLIDLGHDARVYLELLHEIRQLWPETRVILLSKSDDIHLWAEAIQLGAHEFLPKPVNSSDLEWTLQVAMEMQRPLKSRVARM